jgi:hypothetical protein
VLEDRDMSNSPLAQVLGERLIDAREAALSLNLPMYWLTHAKERQRLGLPHYRVGKLVRFKLNELIAWIDAQQPQALEAARKEEADAGLQ